MLIRLVSSVSVIILRFDDGACSDVTVRSGRHSSGDDAGHVRHECAGWRRWWFAATSLERRLRTVRTQWHLQTISATEISSAELIAECWRRKNRRFFTSGYIRIYCVCLVLFRHVQIHLNQQLHLRILCPCAFCFVMSLSSTIWNGLGTIVSGEVRLSVTLIVISWAPCRKFC